MYIHIYFTSGRPRAHPMSRAFFLHRTPPLHVGAILSGVILYPPVALELISVRILLGVILDPHCSGINFGAKPIRRLSNRGPAIVSIFSSHRAGPGPTFAGFWGPSHGPGPSGPAYAPGPCGPRYETGLWWVVFGLPHDLPGPSRD